MLIIYVKEDDSVVVVIPAPNQTMQEVINRFEELNPDLKNRPKFIRSADQFPIRSEIDSQGDILSKREGWKWDHATEQLVLDEERVAPNFGPVVDRINQQLTNDEKLALGSRLFFIKEAAQKQDLNFIKGIYQSLISDPDIPAQTKKKITTTFQAKRIV